MSGTDSHDQIYALPMESVAGFVFDDKVAAVFPDMIRRSVPGYTTILRMIGLLAARAAPAQGRCYDLGCSLGAAALAMAQSVQAPSRQVVAVDNSIAMLSRARRELSQTAAGACIDLVCADVRHVQIQDAAMVVLNFTLQFIPLAERLQLLQRIHAGLRPGGLLVLSEKIQFEDDGFHALFTEMHHQFKLDQGYSALEVSQKRSALENVLLPETVETHHQRLQTVGFQRHTLWFQCFNFVSLLAVKGC